MELLYSEVYETPVLYFLIFNFNKQKFVEFEEYKCHFMEKDEYKDNGLLNFSYELTKEVKFIFLKKESSF